MNEYRVLLVSSITFDLNSGASNKGLFKISLSVIPALIAKFRNKPTFPFHPWLVTPRRPVAVSLDGNAQFSQLAKAKTQTNLF